MLFGINSTRNATNSTRLHLVLLRASLVPLIPNSTAARAITYTYLCIYHLQYRRASFAVSNIWLRTALCVILFDLNPVQYRKAVCRILVVWFIMIIYYIFTCCRASEASETPSIATYRKKCLGVSMSKPQCACSQFYVKRRSGRACI